MLAGFGGLGALLWPSLRDGMHGSAGSGARLFAVGVLMLGALGLAIDW